jgi:lipopolysaccharide export system permease protein
MFIAFTALGDARTTRQGRGMAVAGAIVGVGALRIAAFAAPGLVARSSFGLIAVYGIPIAAIMLCLLMIYQGPRVKALGAQVTRWASDVLPPILPRLGRVSP